MWMFRAECEILLASSLYALVCLCLCVCIWLSLCLCICICICSCICICVYVSLCRYAVSYNYLLETSLIVLKFFKARFAFGLQDVEPDVLQQHFECISLFIWYLLAIITYLYLVCYYLAVDIESFNGHATASASVVESVCKKLMNGRTGWN